MTNFLLIIIWFSIVGGTFIYLFWDNVKLWYLLKKSPTIQERFPEHHTWNPHDKILFVNVQGKETIGLLVAMSNKSILLQDEYGRTMNRPVAFVNDNISVVKRKLKKEFENYHNDILPSLGSGFELPDQLLLND